LYITAIEELVGSTYNFAPCELLDRVRNKLRNKFERIDRFVAAKWLLESEVVSVEDDDNYDDLNLENILFTLEFESTPDRREFLSILSLDENRILQIAQDTIGQWKNRTFCMLRRFRLTASNFKIALTAVRRNSCPPSSYKRLLGGYNLDKVILRRNL